MNNKLTAGVVTALIVVIGIGLYVASNPGDDSVSNNTSASQQKDTSSPTMNTTEISDQPTNQMYTLEDVSMHDSENNCWTVINGTVYDLTSYIPRHPGSDNILSACGVDATSYFSGQQAGQEGGVNNHTSSNSALNQLERLKIGSIQQ